ncbi:MAG: formyltransferase family protein [Pseudomonadota bacterium]
MRIALIGRSEILYDTAHALRALGHEIAVVVTAKEAPEYTRSLEDFKQLASACNAPFFHAPSMQDRQAVLQQLASLPPMDIGISYNYTGVIPQTIIDLFPLGILNAHGGDLPRYRGNACQAWAIVNGEERIGLCVHRMVGGELDSGDIVAREYLALVEETSITEVVQWMGERIPVLFTQGLSALARDPSFVVERQSTNPADALRCYPRKPEDGRIDWSSSAANILRLINASNKPYAGAFCHYEGKLMIIWKASIIRDEERFVAVHGQVMRIGEDCIDVATGDGKLRIFTVEYDGTVGTPSAFIRSIRKRLGAGVQHA